MRDDEFDQVVKVTPLEYYKRGSEKSIDCCVCGTSMDGNFLVITEGKTVYACHDNYSCYSQV